MVYKDNFSEQQILLSKLYDQYMAIPGNKEPRKIRGVGQPAFAVVESYSPSRIDVFRWLAWFQTKLSTAPTPAPAPDMETAPAPAPDMETAPEPAPETAETDMETETAPAQDTGMENM